MLKLDFHQDLNDPLTGCNEIYNLCTLSVLLFVLPSHKNTLIFYIVLLKIVKKQRTLKIERPINHAVYFSLVSTTHDAGYSVARRSPAPILFSLFDNYCPLIRYTESF